MKKNISGRVFAFFLFLWTLFALLFIPAAAQNAPLGPKGDGRIVSAFARHAPLSRSAGRQSPKIGSRFWELLFCEEDLPAEKEDAEGETAAEKPLGAPRLLCPGGDLFGVRITGCGVTVEEIAGAGINTPFAVGDKILSIDGVPVTTSEQVRRIVERSEGGALRFEVERDGRTLPLDVIPQEKEGAYRIGIALNDTAAGIGTVTFVDPDTGSFGGLGHGICDSETGDLLPMEDGDVTGVILGGVKRGESGAPGELRGILTEEAIGDVSLNTDCGVFGRIGGEKIRAYPREAAIPIAAREEVHEGAAVIRSTLKNGRTAEYSIRIEEIDRASDGAKSFRIRVDDPALLAITGGIVRGMSGSPILQDGKLVGAVTHVMINDPTAGYGIFLDNMLQAAQNTQASAA